MFSANEITLNVSGLAFDVHYGTHTNGGWCAIVNFGVAAELSASPYDAAYNTEKIHKALSHSPDAAWLPQDEQARKAIAHTIAEELTKRISARMPETYEFKSNKKTFHVKPLGCKGDTATIKVLDYDITLDLPLTARSNTDLFVSAFMQNQKYLDDTNGGDKVQLTHLASDITGMLNHILYNDRHQTEVNF